jgi:hypothetical protein
MSKASSPSILPMAAGTIVGIVAALLAGLVLFEFGVASLALVLGATWTFDAAKIAEMAPLLWVQAVIGISSGLVLFIWGMRRAMRAFGWTGLVLEFAVGTLLLLNFFLSWHPLALIVGIISIVFGMRTYRANMALIKMAGGAIGGK